MLQVVRNIVNVTICNEVEKWIVEEMIIMSQLSKLLNIGKMIEEQLNQVGITTEEELKQCGAKQAWLAIQKIKKTLLS